VLEWGVCSSYTRAVSRNTEPYVFDPHLPPVIDSHGTAADKPRTALAYGRGFQIAVCGLHCPLGLLGYARIEARLGGL
jgi:hypothetical protein